MADTTFTGQIAASTAPWTVRDPHGVWAALNAAKAHMVEQVYAIVADQGSPDDPANFRAGWSALLDPDNCPAQFIPYGAAFVGVPIPPGTPEADARAIWKNEAGFQRGTPAAIIAAAKRFLIGTQSVALVERSPTPYHFLLVARPGEVMDVNGLKAAVDATRPVGVQWTLILSDAPLLLQYTRLFSAITVPLNAATIADVT